MSACPPASRFRRRASLRHARSPSLAKLVRPQPWVSPSLALGARGSIAARWRTASIAVEARGDLPASNPAERSLPGGIPKPCFFASSGVATCASPFGASTSRSSAVSRAAPIDDARVASAAIAGRSARLLFGALPTSVMEAGGGLGVFLPGSRDGDPFAIEPPWTRRPRPGRAPSAART